MSGNKSCTVIDKNFAKLVQLYQTTMPSYDTKPELFKKLLDKDFDVHYKIPESDNAVKTNPWGGFTIFQLVYTEIEMVKALLDRGADYTVKDEGSTVLLDETVSYGYSYYLGSLRSRAGCEEFYANIILSAHIDSQNTVNPRDKNGLSHFHVACMYNRADVAKFFLESGVSINETVNSDSKFYPGYSALHFTVKSCALETVELLLKFGADMFAKDSKGMNALEVLIVERRKIFIVVQRLFRLTSLHKRKKECCVLKNYYNRNKKIINLLLEMMNEYGCYLDSEAGLSYFHLICLMGDAVIIEKSLHDNKESLNQFVSKKSLIWPGYTPLHFAVHSNVETVELLVKSGADLSAKDANGETPFDLCLREFSIADVHRILLLCPDYSNIVFSDGKTKLYDFIQAIQKPTDFESFLKKNLTDPNMFIPFDSPLCAGCTPLHLAVMCTGQPMNWDSKVHDYSYVLIADMKSEKARRYHSKINSCLNYNPNVTSRDARGSTPLHLAFRLHQSQAVHNLLERHETSTNYVDEHGLSHLHIACAAGNETVVQKLLSGGANVNEVATSSYTWMEIDTSKTWLPSGEVITYNVKKGSTPLHFATRVNRHQIVKMLIEHDADVLAKDVDDLNPLERIFKAPIFKDSDCPKPSRTTFYDERVNEIIKLLVRRIGQLLSESKPKQMLYCYSLLEDSLFGEVLRQGDESATKILETAGITALHVACFTRNLEKVNESADLIDVNARVDLESPLWPGCTPLHLFNKHRWNNRLDDTRLNKAILKKLLRAGADVAVVNAKGDTPIHQIFLSNWISLAKQLKYLKDFSVNPMGSRGFTHLHIASCFDAAWIVENFLDQGAIVDQPSEFFAENFGGFTALHLAAAYRQKNVMDVLLSHGADVNWRNACGGNALHAANWEDRQPCVEVLQILIGAGADIHARNMYGETPLEALIKSSNRTMEEIELFLAHGSSVNTVNTMSDIGFLATALNRNKDVPVFELVINAPDVKYFYDNGRNAIHNAVTFKRPDWLDLEEERMIDEKFTPSDDYIKGIGLLVKLGLNIDQQDCKGLTPLHIAAQMQNLTGIIGLLENGTDINIQDTDGKPAFAYSLELTKLHKKPMELDLRILKVISTYMRKLELAKIGISKYNREVNAKIREMQTIDASKIENCKNEIERMENKEIDTTSVTLYEFLSDTGAVSAFPRLLVCKRIDIESFFKNEVESLREYFPEMTGVLLLQYRKALARDGIIDPAVNSLNFLVDFNMPLLCSDIILRFLSNDELNSLINSA